MIGQTSTAGGEPRSYSWGSRTASLNLVHDRKRSRLYHVNGSWMVGFSLDDQRVSWFARDWLVRQVAIDDDYLYWPYHRIDTDASNHGRIIRMPLDHTPVLVADPVTP